MYDHSARSSVIDALKHGFFCLGCEGRAREYRTHLSLWSMVGTPLIAGNDLRSMARDIQDILTNREVLAVDQDKLGKGGARIVSNGDTEVWARPLEDGAWAAALFNRGEMPNPVSIAWSSMQLKRVESVRDLWTHASVKPGDTGFDAVVPPHGVVMVRVTGRCANFNRSLQAKSAVYNTLKVNEKTFSCVVRDRCSSFAGSGRAPCWSRSGARPGRHACAEKSEADQAGRNSCCDGVVHNGDGTGVHRLPCGRRFRQRR